MYLFDSHCHIDDHIFNKDFKNMLKRATENDVKKMIVVGIDKNTSQKAINLAENHKKLYASIGYHPHNANRCNLNDLKYLKKIAQNPKIVAWGEIGLDFNRMHSSVNEQKICFLRQLEISKDLNLPIIIHERESKGMLLKILTNFSTSQLKGVVHCFSGNNDEMKQYLDLGLYIGITGIITMETRGENLKKLIKYIPSNQILIETDAPYLTPEPNKNKTKRNEPAFLRSILFKLAEIRQEDTEILAKKIWNNTHTLFKIERTKKK